MSYQKPELFLVGAAQGLVLGAGQGDHTDNEACFKGTASRSGAIC